MVGLWYYFHKRLLLPLNMCVDIRKSLAHMWEPIIESIKDHVWLSDFIFKSHSLPRSKISNLSRFWISIDLNKFGNVFGREMHPVLIFSDKKGTFFYCSPSICEGGCYVSDLMSLQKKIEVITKTLWKFLILTHNHHKSFYCLLCTKWRVLMIRKIFEKSLSPSIDDPFLI